jgi:hypothetical protein
MLEREKRVELRVKSDVKVEQCRRNVDRIS